MEIEIVTTKRKLAKTILSQMHSASKEALDLGEVLGYLVSPTKSLPGKTMLIYFDNDYYLCSMGWTKGESSIFRKIGTWSQSKKFEGIVDCSNWWAAYERAKEKATTHIYF